MSELGNNFNKEEKNNLFGLPSISVNDALLYGNIFTAPIKFQYDLFSGRFNNTEKVDENEEKQGGQTDYSQPFEPLKKVGGGRVLQYPLDLNTDLQDYFEIQIFKYRPAGSLPSITESNQVGGATGGYNPNSNRRGNRQNFRLQD